MSSTRAVGTLGEEAAVAFLERRGLRLVDTNVQFGPKSGLKGELDIIAWDGDTLAFIEVKTRHGRPGRVAPSENITPAKRRQLAQLAHTYAARHGLLDEDDLSLRFDVMSVFLGDDSAVLAVHHTKGAFIAGD
jgi:putative endonuclease